MRTQKVVSVTQSNTVNRVQCDNDTKPLLISSQGKAVTLANGLSSSEIKYLTKVEDIQLKALKAFGRENYLFSTARLSKKFNPLLVFLKNPRFIWEALRLKSHIQKLKHLCKNHPNCERTKRLYTSSLSYYVATKLMLTASALANKEMQLKINTEGLGFTDSSGNSVNEISYRDAASWAPRIGEKDKRDEFARRYHTTFLKEFKEKTFELFNKGNSILASLGHNNLIDLYSWSSGHDLNKLGKVAQDILDNTDVTYHQLISKYYQKRTGLNMEHATHADVHYLFSGVDSELEEIERAFQASNLIPLLRKTFDGVGLDFSGVAKEVNFKSKDEYWSEINNLDRSTQNIFLDMEKRRGKSPRAHVALFDIPSEIFLVLNPVGGLRDYDTAFHEAGHAFHHANTDPSLDFASKLLGNKTATEVYAYIFQSLFRNPHFLENQIGLSKIDAQKLIQKMELTNLYMLRRYCSKMQFELKLFEGDISKPINENELGELYASLLLQNTGFRVKPDSFIKDVDPGFYVADYLSAWILEAQLEEFLASNYGTPANNGNDWYLNKDAGRFLKSLWSKGQITQYELSKELGYNDPIDITPLLLKSHF